jgi:hypothetical protein
MSNRRMQSAELTVNTKPQGDEEKAAFQLQCCPLENDSSFGLGFDSMMGGQRAFRLVSSRKSETKLGLSRKYFSDGHPAHDQPKLRRLVYLRFVGLFLIIRLRA